MTGRPESSDSLRFLRTLETRSLSEEAIKRKVEEITENIRVDQTIVAVEGLRTIARLSSQTETGIMILAPGIDYVVDPEFSEDGRMNPDSLIGAGRRVFEATQSRMFHFPKVVPMPSDPNTETVQERRYQIVVDSGFNNPFLR